MISGNLLALLINLEWKQSSSGIRRVTGVVEGVILKFREAKK